MQFPLITAIRMCHYLPVHHLGMAFLAESKAKIQQMNTYYDKDNNAGTALSIINYWKFNPHWGNGNKTTEKKPKSFYLDFV